MQLQCLALPALALGALASNQFIGRVLSATRRVGAAPSASVKFKCRDKSKVWSLHCYNQIGREVVGMSVKIKMVIAPAVVEEHQASRIF